MTAYFNNDELVSLNFAYMAAVSIHSSSIKFCTTKLPDNTTSKRWYYIPIRGLTAVGISLISVVASIVATVESVFKGAVNILRIPFSKNLSILRGLKQLTITPITILCVGIIYVPLHNAYAMVPFRKGTTMALPPYIQSAVALPPQVAQVA